MSKYIINGYFPSPNDPMFRVHNVIFREFVALYSVFSKEIIDTGIRFKAIDLLMSLVYIDSYIFSYTDLSDFDFLTKQNVDFLHEVLKSSQYSRKRQVSRK